MTAQQDVTGRDNTRRAPRLNLPAMYTVVRVRPKGDTRYRWTGFAYDISNTGMRFELDEPLSPGSPLDVRVMLPGSPPSTFHATGRVIRMHDDPDEPGPVRMAMHFDTFRLAADRNHLAGYLSTRLSQAAA